MKGEEHSTQHSRLYVKDNKERGQRKCLFDLLEHVDLSFFYFIVQTRIKNREKPLYARTGGIGSIIMVNEELCSLYSFVC